MAKYTLSKDAERDIVGITRYTKVNFGVEQARNYANQLYQSAQIAADFPSTGSTYTTKAGKSYLRYNCGQHSIFYEEEEGGIFIGRILHQMMDFDRHLNT